MGQGNVFTPVCHSFCSEGDARGEGGYVWWRVGVYGEGGMHGKGSVHGEWGVHGKGGACVVKGVCMANGGMCGKVEVCMAKGACMSRGVCAGETATQVAGTHPTGMHPCFKMKTFSSN